MGICMELEQLRKMSDPNACYYHLVECDKCWDAYLKTHPDSTVDRDIFRKIANNMKEIFNEESLIL